VDLELYVRAYLLVLDGPTERHLLWDHALSLRWVQDWLREVLQQVPETRGPPSPYKTRCLGRRVERLRVGLASLLEGSALHLAYQVSVRPEIHPIGCGIFKRFVIIPDGPPFLNQRSAASIGR